MKGTHIDSRGQHRLVCGHVAGPDMYCMESWCRMSRANVESERARMSARWSRPGASWADRSLSTGECSRCGYVVCGCEAEKGATAISGYYDRMIAVAKRWKIVEDERASFNDRHALAERMCYDELIDPKAAERVIRTPQDLYDVCAEGSIDATWRLERADAWAREGLISDTDAAKILGADVPSSDGVADDGVDPLTLSSMCAAVEAAEDAWGRSAASVSINEFELDAANERRGTVPCDVFMTKRGAVSIVRAKMRRGRFMLTDDQQRIAAFWFAEFAK